MITPVYSPVGRGGRLDPLRESIGMVTLSCRVANEKSYKSARNS